MSDDTRRRIEEALDGLAARAKIHGWTPDAAQALAALTAELRQLGTKAKAKAKMPWEPNSVKR